MDDRRRSAVVAVQRSISLIVRNARSSVLGRHVAGLVGVTLRDVDVAILPYIHRSQPVRVSDLAQMLHREIPTVSRHLSTLDREGLIVRQPHAEDGRSILVSLSPLGEEVFRTTLGSWLETIDEILDTWDDERIVEFSDELAKFAALLAEFVYELGLRPRTPGGNSVITSASRSDSGPT